jgi:signal transduction histidine kinase
LKKRKALVVVEATGNEANSVGRKLPLAQDERAQQVYKSRQPQLVSDCVDKDEDLPEGMVSVRSWMWAPLAIENRGLGVLAVNNQGSAGYTEEDLSNFQELAHYAAIAIDNARRYEEAHTLAADEERKRLARELHDSVTQALFSASLIADVLPQLFEVDPAEANGALGTLGTLTHGALAEMRSLLLELRPADLLNARLDSVIAQLGMATTVRMPMEVSTRLDPAPRLPQKVQVAFYRITQEALNNIIKHARAGKVAISLQTTPPVTAANGDSWSGTMALTIVDDGVGFDARNNARKISDGQMGLASMSERARAISATLRIESGPGSGTKVALNWEGAAKMKERTYQP